MDDPESWRWLWLVGLALFGIVMGFGFTGYLLPWDQRAYWATTVGVEIMDKTPLVGDFMARFLKGGPTPGQMTLSRFFVIHVMILPAALMGLAGLHLFLFRSAGPAGPFRGTQEEIKAKTNALAQASMKLGEAMYKAQQAEGAAADAAADGAQAPSGGDENVVDADFEEVDEKKT